MGRNTVFLLLVGILAGLALLKHLIGPPVASVEPTPEDSSREAPLEFETAAELLLHYRSVGWETLASALNERLRPALRLQHADPEAANHGSHLGGLPSLSNQQAWPTWKGKSLSFLGQVRLDALPSGPASDLLPREGLLLFFYDPLQGTWGFDPADAGSWRVLYLPELPAEKSSIEFPADLPEEGRYVSVPVGGRAFLDLPSLEELDAARTGVPDEDSDGLWEVHTQHREGHGPLHQLLGYSSPVQGDMKLEVQLVTNGLYVGDASGYEDPRRKELEAGAIRWRLLLQIDSDDRAGMMWGDMGRLYFWITEQDLEARRFDNVWMVLQCS